MFKLSALLLLVQYTSADPGVCVVDGDSCVQDCDCCGFHTGSVCKTKFHVLGPRCYISRKVGEVCEEDDHCLSQSCSGGVCQAVGHEPNIIHRHCPITYPTDDLVAIYGSITEEADTCPCEDPETYPLASPPENVLKPNGVYINNFPINSGFLVVPSYHFPVRRLVVCTSDEDPAYDPSSFRLEGRCAGCEEFVFLDEGPLNLPLERNRCIKVTVKDRDNIPSFQSDEIKVIFPTIRGGFDKCTSGCQNYPVIVEKVGLLGNCKDRNLCKLKSRVYDEVTGSLWTPPSGSCPVCDRETDFPEDNHPGRVLWGGEKDPYINYKAVGSGVIFELVEKAVRLVRVYPSHLPSSGDPVTYEIYGSTDKQEFTLLSSGSITLPATRNTDELKHYAEIQFENEYHYDIIKIIFPAVEGSFDSSCETGEDCRDYPLVIGGIDLIGWC